MVESSGAYIHDGGSDVAGTAGGLARMRALVDGEMWG